MTGIMAIGPDVAYTPNSATNDELRLSEMQRNG
jgi:peptide/nickel transport system substrate-binding protein